MSKAPLRAECNMLEALLAKSVAENERLQAKGVVAGILVSDLLSQLAECASELNYGYRYISGYKLRVEEFLNAQRCDA